jgi:hypothetical protein
MLGADLGHGWQIWPEPVRLGKKFPSRGILSNPNRVIGRKL